MRALIEALHNLPPKKEKVHTVTIQGQSVVVSLKKKLEVIQHGEDAYMWKTPMEFVLKPRPKIKRGYNILKKSDKGYNFYDNDPYYPNKIVDGGYKWVQE